MDESLRLIVPVAQRSASVLSGKRIIAISHSLEAPPFSTHSRCCALSARSCISRTQVAMLEAVEPVVYPISAGTLHACFHRYLHNNTHATQYVISLIKFDG